MLIKDIQVGQLETNAYIVTDESTLECVVIDPGDESGTILNYLEEHKLKCRYIFLTHGHYDHTTAALTISEETGAPIYIHRKDVSDNPHDPYTYTPRDEISYYSEGDRFTIGTLTFTVLETPGHSPGSISLVCGEALFSGDTLFRDSAGRTDLPGGDMPTLLLSLKKLYELPGEYEVYPGHLDSSTLDRERRFNYYMKHAISGRA